MLPSVKREKGLSMKDKMYILDRKEIVLPEGIAKPYIDAIEELQLPYQHGARDCISVENVDRILTIAESFLTQFGLLQLCIELSWSDDEEVMLYIGHETEKFILPNTNAYLPWIPIARFPKYNSGSSIYGDDNYVKDCVAWGRKLYFALRKKHPLLTRDLNTGGFFKRATCYELVCEKCGMVRKKYRRCPMTNHPERYRCTCGGKVKLTT